MKSPFSSQFLRKSTAICIKNTWYFPMCNICDMDGFFLFVSISQLFSLWVCYSVEFLGSTTRIHFLLHINRNSTTLFVLQISLLKKQFVSTMCNANVCIYLYENNTHLPTTWNSFIMSDKNNSLCWMLTALEKFTFTICLIQMFIHFKSECIMAYITRSA